MLKASPTDVPAQVQKLVDRLRATEKELERLRSAALVGAAAELAEQAVEVDGIAFVGHRAEGAGGADVRSIALDVRGRLQDRPAVVVVIGTGGGKPSAVVAITKAAQDLGIAANQLIDLVGTHIGGRGGGKADVAQGGGTDVGGIEAALTAVQASLARP
jgi:alanyl-tRNA synthetase